MYQRHCRSKWELNKLQRQPHCKRFIRSKVWKISKKKFEKARHRSWSTFMQRKYPRTFQVLNFKCWSDMEFFINLLNRWCNPCKMLMPRIESVVQETNGKVDLAKVSGNYHMQICNAIHWLIQWKFSKFIEMILHFSRPA